ncbi:MAG: DNA translocase FtsK 4TM domain-containing protein [Bacillota bacterium]
MARKSRSNTIDLKKQIIGVLVFAAAAFSLVSIYVLEVARWPKAEQAIGPVGSILFRLFSALAGEGKFILAVLVLLYGLKLVRARETARLNSRNWGILILYLVFLIFLHLEYVANLGWWEGIQAGMRGHGGGLLGSLFAGMFFAAFGPLGTYIVLAAISLISLLLIANGSSFSFLARLGEKLRHIYLVIRERLLEFLFIVEDDASSRPTKKGSSRVKAEELVIINHAAGKTPIAVREREVTSRNSHALVYAPEITEEGEKEVKTIVKGQPHDAEKKRSGSVPHIFQLPPLTLLKPSLKLKNPRINKDITENVRILEETLESFGVQGKVTQVSCGPTITRYEMQPAPGVKVSKIVNLADDIALSLAAPQVRIEAPIPGKAALGIEVPNKEIATVHFREVLETEEFLQSQSILTVALGKDIAGNPIVADLAKMPHLLIAGATGSGKSVCMNSLICSLLFKGRPDQLKFLMIDPKMVELSNYNGVPHLVSPVVTDPKKAAGALRWAVNEMEKRYELFAAAGVRDIQRYNELKSMNPNGEEPSLPFIVVLVDELADLMMVAPVEVEDAICRLAQMARAAGIHLVVATQRPSVDVITGVIKANIPSRIAFAVSSQIDSRTILDMGGAEKLLGRGDMLFYPVGMSKPIRVQGVYVSDKEVEAIVDFLKAQAAPEYLEEVTAVQEDFGGEAVVDDELLPEAARLLIENGQASISMLQRRLRIGYNRAARLMDQMEARGIVGSFEGSKPRAVLIGWEEYRQMFGE